MGQYYKVINLSTKEFYSPDWVKLMEHSYIGNRNMSEVCFLLSPGGPWHKSRIVWAGDYDDRGKFNQYLKSRNGKISKDAREKTLYEYMTLKGKHVRSYDVMDGPSPVYIINHSKGMYIDLSMYSPYVKEEGEDEDLTIHPLSILTCSGNGRGGGDFNDENDDPRIGYWVADIISTDWVIPKGMNLVCPTFSYGSRDIVDELEEMGFLI